MPYQYNPNRLTFAGTRPTMLPLFAQTRPSTLPLPKGEGWGEGEEDVRSHRSCASPGLTVRRKRGGLHALSASPWMA